MIVRIVKLRISKEETKDFCMFFNSKKSKIEEFKGCIKVELLQDTKESNQYFTHSHWEDEQSLDNYRNSVFFKNVWNNTKLYFCGKPQAWSLKEPTNE
jgi:heme-degrading monooxygenase HmoA